MHLHLRYYVSCLSQAAQAEAELPEVWLQTC